MAVQVVRHCYGLIKERRDPWKSRITGRLRKYFPISRRVERRVGKELSRTWASSRRAGEISHKTTTFDRDAWQNTMLTYITFYPDCLTNQESLERN